MKFCTNCGFQLDDSAAFCTKCGSKQKSGQSILGDSTSNDNRVEEVSADNVYEQSSYEQNMSDVYHQGKGESDNFNYEQQYFSPNGYEQNGYGQNGYEQNSYGQNSYGQNGYGQNNYNQGNFGQAPLKKKSKAPLIIGITSAIVAVIAIVIGIFLLTSSGGANSAKGAAEGFLKAYCKLDGKKMVKYIAYSSEYKDDIQDIIDEYDDSSSYISLIDMSYKIKSTKKLSKSETEDFWYDNEYDTFVDEDDVTELTEVKASVSISVFGEKETESMSIYVGKYKGKWKVIYTDWF